MHFGASMFFTDYSMTSAALAKALEERGFEFGLGAGTLPHPAVAALALAGRRRTAEACTTT